MFAFQYSSVFTLSVGRFSPFLLFVLLTVTMSATVGGFTCTFACRLSPHLQAIPPRPGNLSWVAALGTDVFDATCR